MPPESPERFSVIYEILPYPFSDIDCSLLDKNIVGETSVECNQKIKALGWQDMNARGRKSVNVEYY